MIANQMGKEEFMIKSRGLLPFPWSALLGVMLF